MADSSPSLRRWPDEQVAAITDGRSSGNAKTDALLEVVREAAGTEFDLAFAVAAG